MVTFEAGSDYSWIELQKVGRTRQEVSCEQCAGLFDGLPSGGAPQAQGDDACAGKQSA